MRIAVIGSGIAGLVCAHVLGPEHDVVLYEADNRFGGHSNTVMVDEGALSHAIDTGFIVHNDRNYPNLVALFSELGVEPIESEMSFAVTDRESGFTYRATSLNSIFADRKNVLAPKMWRMLIDIFRFYRDANAFLDDTTAPSMSIGQFCEANGYSETFMQLHLIPMGAAVWSASPQTFDEFPARSLLQFLSNHGLLGVRDRPTWKTVKGGSKVYVEEILNRFDGDARLNARVESITRSQLFASVTSSGRTEQFDEVILACHSDQALALLSDPTADESDVLGAIRYQPNTATLHTDSSLMSPKRGAWAAWNYERLGAKDQLAPITYDLTTLQRLKTDTHYLVSLNSADRIDPGKVIASFDYSHPVFDGPAVAAQSRWSEISGVRRTHFCGAYWSYGFHEDGIKSGLRVCDALGASR